jgi:hypothetical protein
MFLRNLSAALLGCALLTAPASAIAAGRGPSTPEERKQALTFIQDFLANPLGPNEATEREWVLKWIIEIPDVHLHMCLNIGRNAKVDKKDSGTIIAAEILAQVAFLLQNPDRQNDRQAEYLAGVEGALRVYEVLLKTDAKHRRPLLDDLIQRRDAGTLAQWVQERIAAECHN